MKGRMLNTLKVDYFENQFNQVVDLSEIRITDFWKIQLVISVKTGIH
jgi:hypothetical protein